MVIDAFLFHNELDLLELRLNILDPYVDKFVLVEAIETFSGLPKPLYYEANKHRFTKWEHKIQHLIVSGYSEEEWAEAKASPNTGGLDHWCREFAQREAIKRGLTKCQDEDIVFVCDVDEIWDADKIPTYIPEPFRLKLDVYTYYLNNRSTEQFWGPIVSTYKNLKDVSLNELKTTCLKTQDPMGWHFTSMGGVEKLKTKLESYGHQEFNTDYVKDNLATAIEANKDFIGRDFEFSTDESKWPQFLRENKLQYIELCRESSNGRKTGKSSENGASVTLNVPEN